MVDFPTFSSTTILSASITVLRRWAMTKQEADLAFLPTDHFEHVEVS
jgi:hypothetical protein